MGKRKLVDVSKSDRIYRDAIDAVASACLDRLDDPGLDFASLAAEAGYSPFHFHRVFAAMTGETPATFIRRLRLERAAATLNQTKLPIGEIAMEAGYGTPDAFARAFKQSFGLLPSEFRGRAYDSKIHSPNRVHFGEKPQVHFQTYGANLMNTTIETRPALNVIGLKHTGAYEAIGQTFGQLMGWAMANGVPMTKVVAVYYDDPAKTPEAELRSDALVVVSEPTSAPEGMVAYEIPAGKYIVGIHEGSYEGLGQAWQALFGEEIPKSGVSMRDGVCYEVYLNDCTQVKPEDLRTEILAPVG